jgi:hypothetical protein
VVRPLPKVDPNTNIPPAVRRLAEQAEATFKAVHGDQNPEPAPNPEPPAEPAPTPEPVAVTPPSNPEPAPAPAPTEVNWEHRYKSMEGRYKRAENDIRALSDQVAHLNSLLSMQPPAAPTPVELQPQSLLSPEEVSEYGDEFLKVVGKKAKEELSPEFMTLKQKLEQIEQRIEGTTKITAAQARRNLEATLDTEVPDWRDINVAPEFHQWLSLPDLFSGAIRHSLLKAAYEQNDTPRVVAFFKGFLSQEAALVPATEPAPGATSDKIPLETFAAPGRAKTAAASGAPAEKPTFTHAQIATFYTDVRRGAYRGREAEKDRIERQIVEAGREGRIR